MVKAIPVGAHTLTACLVCSDAARAIEFYKRIFGAIEIMRIATPDGRIAHGELTLGDSNLLVSDEFTEIGQKSAQSLRGSPVMIHFYTKNVDDTVKKACAAGAELQDEVKDQYYGDRAGAITDPFGHRWWIATHIEDVSEDEMHRRANRFWEEQEQRKQFA